MGNIAMQEGRSTVADAPARYSATAEPWGVGANKGFAAQSNFSDGWPAQPSRRKPYRSSLSRRLRLFFGRSRVVFAAKVLWASTWSIWGLGIGTVGLLTGGGVRRSGRILEFWGGFLPLFLKHFPFVAGSPVATFGHVVVGRCQRHLDACRPHQLIHVQQYERWGPLFVPMYLAWGFVLWCCGKRPYYDNPFEREAFDRTG